MFFGSADRGARARIDEVIHESTAAQMICRFCHGQDDNKLEKSHHIRPVSHPAADT